MHSAALRKRTCDATTQRLRGAFERMITPPDASDLRANPVAQSTPELMRILAFEIDETVLPRRLMLRSNGETVAELTVTNRRLVGLNVGGRAVEVAPDEDVDPDEVARRYAGALASLCAASGPLELCRAGRAAKATTGSTACTAHRLAAATDTPDVEDRVKAFLQHIHAASSGWIYRAEQDEAVAYDPDAAVFEALRRLDDALCAQAKETGAFQKLDRPGPLCSAFEITADVQVMVATERKTRLIVGLPKARLAEAMTQWQSLFATSDAG